MVNQFRQHDTKRPVIQDQGVDSFSKERPFTGNGFNFTPKPSFLRLDSGGEVIAEDTGFQFGGGPCRKENHLRPSPDQVERPGTRKAPLALMEQIIGSWHGAVPMYRPNGHSRPTSSVLPTATSPGSDFSNDHFHMCQRKSQSVVKSPPQQPYSMYRPSRYCMSDRVPVHSTHLGKDIGLLGAAPWAWPRPHSNMIQHGRTPLLPTTGCYLPQFGCYRIANTCSWQHQPVNYGICRPPLAVNNYHTCHSNVPMGHTSHQVHSGSHPSQHSKHRHHSQGKRKCKKVKSDHKCPKDKNKKALLVGNDHHSHPSGPADSDVNFRSDHLVSGVELETVDCDNGSDIVNMLENLTLASDPTECLVTNLGSSQTCLATCMPPADMQCDDALKLSLENGKVVSKVDTSVQSSTSSVVVVDSQNSTKQSLASSSNSTKNIVDGVCDSKLEPMCTLVTQTVTEEDCVAVTHEQPSLMKVDHRCALLRKKRKGRPSGQKRRRRKLERENNQKVNLHISPSDIDECVDAAMFSVSSSAISSTREAHPLDSITSFSCVVTPQLVFGNSDTIPVLQQSSKSESPPTKFSFVVSAKELESDESDDEWHDADSEEALLEHSWGELEQEFSCFHPLLLHVSVHPVVSRDEPECSTDSIENHGLGASSHDQTAESIDRVKAANATWSSFYDDISEYPCQEVTPTKVCFGDVEQVIEPPEMANWAEDYAAARHSPWQVYAQDRWRFKRRVQDIEATIGHHFTPQHRQRVWKERFSDSHR